MGPFKTFANRMAARYTLARCKAVVARGSISFEHLKDLKLPNSYYFPDVSFMAEITPAHVTRAREIFSSKGLRPSPAIISPSRVVERYCERDGIDFLKSFEDIVSQLRGEGHQVVLFAHSLGVGASKNNDIDVCNRIKHRFAHDDDVVVVTEIEDAFVARAAIGLALFFVGCRFHSVVASLSRGVPSIIIGWSHKYLEMVKPFGIDACVFSWSDLGSDRLVTQIDKCLSELEQYRTRISAKALETSRASFGNIQILQIGESGNGA
jgi:polysaccharide pyruvyl transferase WcaK-like protein